MASSNVGLYRQPGGKGARCPTWLVRRDVPADLRSRTRADGRRFGRVLKSTTGTTDPRVARIETERLWKAWGAEFALARAAGSGPILTIDAALGAIAAWRGRECALAGEMQLSATLTADERWAMESAGTARLDHAQLLAMRRREEVAPLAATRWALAYFDAHPEALRAADPFLHVAQRLEALQQAASSELGWAAVSGFDADLEAAVSAGGGEGAWRRWFGIRCARPLRRRRWRWSSTASFNGAGRRRSWRRPPSYRLRRRASAGREPLRAQPRLLLSRLQQMVWSPSRQGRPAGPVPLLPLFPARLQGCGRGRGSPGVHHRCSWWVGREAAVGQVRRP